MSYRLEIILPCLLLCYNALMADEIIWKGTIDNDFFNELNWQVSGSDISPENGTIDPNQTINHQLVIANSPQEIIANGIISLGTQTLSVNNASVKADAIYNGTLVIGSGAYVLLYSGTPLTGTSEVNFKPDAGWLKLTHLETKITLSNNIHRFKIDGSIAKYKTNLRIDNYYEAGSVVRADNADVTPLTVYSEKNQSGTSANLKVDVIHSGSSIPKGLDNAISSFVLKRGFMAVMADIETGTGISKVFIASEKDLVLSELPDNLKGTVSFIRVLPWNWVSKKGIGGNATGLNETWHYLWGNGGESSIDREYTPMAWGKGGADDDNDIELYKSKYNVTHVMAFNESDNCNDQSGKWGDLCQTDVAVPIYKNLMKTGLRLVSPSCRENAPFGWLKEFYDKATAQNIRIDVIGVHWYDWGSNPANSPNADPQQVFNRFKTYLQKVYDLYQLPIWITEFNANPNRTTAVNKAFMELALPSLESLDYVERYAWFEPSSDVADYYDAQGNYTQVGLVYKNRVSTPSIPEDVLSSSNNLDNGSNDNSIVFEDYFETYTNGQDLSSFYTVWAGPANAVDGTQTSTWGTASEGDGFGKSNDAKEAFYLRKTFTLEAGKTYVWELATKMTDGEKHSLNVLPGDIYPKKECYNSTWEKHNVEFTVQSDNTSVTLALYRWPKKNLYFDNFVLKEKDYNTATYDITQFKLEGVLIYPNPVREILNIKLDDDRLSNGIFRVYNVYGNLVMQGLQANSIDVSSLSAGIYFFILENRMAKFVKY